MKLKLLVCLFVLSILSITVTAQVTNDESYLTWSAQQAKDIGEAWRVKGRVGGFFDMRVQDTDKSYNFKLRATLMSPEVVRATARIEQIRSYLTADETRALVIDAEQGDYLVMLVEIDPNEGSGVIPPDWRVILHPKGIDATKNRPIKGIEKSTLRNIKTLTGVAKRDYDYDVFWMAFSLKDSKRQSLWESVPNELELSVAIYGKEGRVSWKVSNPLRLRIEELIK